MRVLAFDIGKTLGFGLLGGERTLSGSHEIVKRWTPLGESLLKLEDRMHSLILAHKPNVLACARPFVRERQWKPTVEAFLEQRYDTPLNLVPMFSGYGFLHGLAAAVGLRLELIEESDARSILLGNMLPQRSDKVKAAVMQACRDRGWPVTDDHAGDALCVAAAITERLDPAQSYEMTPLFQAAPTMRQRRRKVRKTG